MKTIAKLLLLVTNIGAISMSAYGLYISWSQHDHTPKSWVLEKVLFSIAVIFVILACKAENRNKSLPFLKDEYEFRFIEKTYVISPKYNDLYAFVFVMFLMIAQYNVIDHELGQELSSKVKFWIHNIVTALGGVGVFLTAWHACTKGTFLRILSSSLAALGLFTFALSVYYRFFVGTLPFGFLTVAWGETIDALCSSLGLAVVIHYQLKNNS